MAPEMPFTGRLASSTKTISDDAYMKILHLILAILPMVAQAETRYKLIALESGDPLHLSGWAFAINSSGDVVGGSLAESAFCYSDANGFADLGQAQPGGTYTVPRGINDSGTITAFANSVPYGYLGLFSYSNGLGFTQIPLPPGADMYSTSINNRGQMAGTYAISNSYNVSFLYTPGQGILDIGSLYGGDSTAFAVNNSGLVTGFIAGERAFVWSPDSGMIDIGPGVGWAINDQGVVAGANGLFGSGAVFANHQTHEIGAGTAEGINNRDTVVGDGAFVWTAAEGLKDLNSLIVTNGDWFLLDAVAVNDRGQIAGNGLFQGMPMAFRLDPIPPTLTITLADTNIVVSWSPAWRDQMLQVKTDLSSTNWVDVAEATSTPVTLPSGPTQNFFRLRRLTNDEMHQQFLQWLSSQP